MKDLDHVVFSDQEIDQLIMKWLSNGLTKDEQEKWNHVLMYNKKFREHFCEWIKCMRDPAWSKKKFYIKKAS